MNLLQGLTLAEGVTLEKVEVETGGQRSLVPDPLHYTPQYPGECRILLTVSVKDATKEFAS